MSSLDRFIRLINQPKGHIAAAQDASRRGLLLRGRRGRPAPVSVLLSGKRNRDDQGKKVTAWR